MFMFKKFFVYLGSLLFNALMFIPNKILGLIEILKPRKADESTEATKSKPETKHSTVEPEMIFIEG